MISAHPRRDAYHHLRLSSDATDLSRRSAASLLVGPVEALADVIADLDSGKLVQILPEHRRDLIYALAGDEAARSRLLSHNPTDAEG